MNRTHATDADGGVDVASKNDAVLICATDQAVRSDVASTLREDFPVRTADSESDAVASIDRNVTVLVFDAADREFSLERLLKVRSERDCRFQIAALVERPTTRWLRARCDGFVRKPVDEHELRSTVRWLHRRGRYDKTLGAYYALSEKYAALASDPDASADDLRSLEEQLMQLRVELDDVGDSLDDEDAFQVALGKPDDPTC